MPDEPTIPEPAVASDPTMLGFLRQIIARDFDVDPQLLHGDARLEDFDIDSLGLIEIMFAVEERFGITVPPRPPEGRTPIQTLDELVRYLEHLVSEQRGASDATDATPPR
jgi:acyl carrier protein